MAAVNGAASAGAVQIVELDLHRHVDDALAVEAAALGRRVEPLRRESYLRHTTYPAFTALAATYGGRIVGFGYGHTDEPGQWWHDEVAPALGAAGHDTWTKDAFVLVEMHVLPDFQRRGIGTALLTRLTAHRAEPRALLSAHDLDTPARRLYRRLGFVDLLTDFHFSGTRQPFAVMGASLPLAQAS